MKNNYKDDLRIIRTKKLLRDSLINLLQKKSIEKINVVEICDNAMIHRATFYKHFEDKYHLLACTLEDIKEEVLIESAEKVEFDSLEEMYLYIVNNLLDYLAENKDILLNIIESNKNDTVIQMIYNAMEKCIEYFLEKKISLNNGKIPITIVARFYAGGITAVALWWVHGKGTISKEELLEYSKIIINEGIINASMAKR